MWLTNGIPAMQQALFQPDPLAALLDDWFLVAQMRHYFARAAEHGMPPHLQELATRVLDDMASDIRLVIEYSGPDQQSQVGSRATGCRRRALQN